MNSSSAAKPPAWDPNDTVSFKDWKEVLEKSDLPPNTISAHRNAIFGFLKYLKAQRKPASVGTVRDYLAAPGDKGQSTEAVRAGLQWFFVTAKNQPKAPPPVADFP